MPVSFPRYLTSSLLSSPFPHFTAPLQRRQAAIQIHHLGCRSYIQACRSEQSSYKPTLCKLHRTSHPLAIGQQTFSSSPSSLNSRFCNLQSLRKYARDLSTVPTRPKKSQYSSSSKQASTHRAAIGGWYSVAIIGIASGGYVLYSCFVGPHITPAQSEQHVQEETPKVAETGNWSAMTGESLPGRPGTLSPEEEEKLREYWIATLQIFGVLTPEQTNGKQLNILNNSENSTSPEKPKKKRMSVFGRKNKDEADSGEQPDEDKYGQTKQAQEALASHSPEEMRKTFWSMVKHDHPDALLLRFLRARKWDVEKALIMAISTMTWRHTEMDVDGDIMKNGEEGALRASKEGTGAEKSLGEGFMAQMRMGKSYLHGTDKEGRPMCYVRVRLHRQGEQSEQSLERYTVFLIESARMILSPPIDTACIVFDMTGFSLANMDYSPVKFMIKCFEANYPESLGVVLVHKAPWVFQGIWKIIRGWLDPVVASKIQFTSNESDFEQYVPKSHIPKEMGGDEDWSYQYLEPVPGENAKMEDTQTRDKLIVDRQELYKRYEAETIRWIQGSKSPEADEIKAKRHAIALELRDDYWKLDPYIRARSLYDRTGLLLPGGKLQFYPGQIQEPKAAVEASKSAAISNGTQKVETSADDID